MPRYAVTPLIVATALFMEQLDGTVLATALPAMAADLHEDPVALKARADLLYALARHFHFRLGWVGDRFGSAVIFRVAIAVFTLGLDWLRASRFICSKSSWRAYSGSRRRDDGAGRTPRPVAYRARVTSSSARSPGLPSRR